MAGKKKGKKKVKQSLTALFAEHGISMSESKELLWDEPTIISEEVAVESIRVSEKYEDSVYAIVRDGDKSRLVSFAKGEVDLNDFTKDEDNILTDAPETISLGIVTALRDDDDLQVRDLQNELVDVIEGTQALRAYL